MKAIYLISPYLDESGNKKARWTRQGVVFDENKDGSLNFKLDMFPHLRFQIRLAISPH